MERPIFKPIGTPALELDTPALTVDVDKLDKNISTMAAFFETKSAKLRPHISGHGSPAIAHKQLASGGTVDGIATTTVGQAEVFARYGFNDIFISNVVATAVKMKRVCALAKVAEITVAVDNASAIDALSEAATTAGTSVNVVIYLRTRQNSIGVGQGSVATDLATMIENANGVNFKGLIAYEGTLLDVANGDIASESRKWVDLVLDTRQTIENAGIDVQVVSIGGTHNYEIVSEIDGVTEVQAGSYALMDEKYKTTRPQFLNAGRVMTCVTSMPEPGTVLTDGGRKAIGADSGVPGIDGMPEATMRGLSAEHGSIAFDPAFHHGLELGDRIWCIPRDIAGSINVHDYLFAIRKGNLEAIWDLPSRGQYR
tara:strand:- start:58 stop:1167 length:1110 start_codon:yes stop_codon:yes gene_type:complete